MYNIFTNSDRSVNNMMTLPTTINVPLNRDDDGTIRVGNTRVLLELVIHAFQQGETAEGIIESYPTLRLDDVYAVLAYYLQHQDAVNTYLVEVDAESQIIRKKIEASQPSLQSVRKKLLQQLHSKSS